MFENSSEVGVFARLTNAYCLVPAGASEGFYRSVARQASSRTIHKKKPSSS